MKKPSPITLIAIATIFNSVAIGINLMNDNADRKECLKNDIHTSDKMITHFANQNHIDSSFVIVLKAHQERIEKLEK